MRNLRSEDDFRKLHLYNVTGVVFPSKTFLFLLWFFFQHVKYTINLKLKLFFSLYSICIHIGFLTLNIFILCMFVCFCYLPTVKVVVRNGIFRHHENHQNRYCIYIRITALAFGHSVSQSVIIFLRGYHVIVVYIS